MRCSFLAVLPDLINPNNRQLHQHPTRLQMTRLKRSSIDSTLSTFQPFTQVPWLSQTNYPNDLESFDKHPCKRQQVKHQRSKLDLIDDTKLTSLPLPHPPPVSLKLHRRILAPVANCRSPTSTINKPYDLPSLLQSSPNNAKENTELNYTDISVCSENLKDESQHLIILVEDYLTNHSVDTNNHIHQLRSKSLADFKKNFACRQTDLSEQRTTSEQSSLDTAVQVTSIGSRKLENLEDIFGKIPGAEELRYCTLCDKPLYEISSLLTNYVGKKSAQKKTCPYRELVCADCIVTYEDFINDLQRMQDLASFSSSLQTLTDKENFECLLDNIRDTTSPDFGHKQALPPKQSQFSADLIGRLHHLRKLVGKQEEWLPRIRHKVNWTSLQKFIFASDLIKPEMHQD